MAFTLFPGNGADTDPARCREQAAGPRWAGHKPACLPSAYSLVGEGKGVDREKGGKCSQRGHGVWSPRLRSEGETQEDP